MWFVYILKCSDNSLYTGYTNNVKKRFETHKLGKGGKYTRSHKPVKIVYKEKLQTKVDALKREREIKSWSREQKLQILKNPFVEC
jgi:putative endonuclease